MAGVSYTVIESFRNGRGGHAPFTSAFLSGPGVTNITLQNQCPRWTPQSDPHLEIAADPVALADVLNALDPAHPVRVPPCLVVLLPRSPRARSAPYSLSF